MITAFLLIIIWLGLFIRFRFWRRATYITFFVLGLTVLGVKFSNSDFYQEYIDPGSNNETDPYNVLISKRPYQKQDNIVIVNIGNLARRDVARQISILSKYGPKVIGIDAYFNCEGPLRDSLNCPQLLDTLGNIMLEKAIADAGNIILVSRLLQKTQSSLDINIIDYDSMEYSDPAFIENAKSGYGNIITNAVSQVDVKESNSFVPSYRLNGKEEYAFATQIAMQYDSNKAKRFLSRSNEEENINFRFNLNQDFSRVINNNDEAEQPISALDVDDILNEQFSADLIKDKIVLMGFLGAFFGDANGLASMYFTPLNKKPYGRANPDMYGVMLYANIVAMILNEDYIDNQSTLNSLTVNFWICLLHISLLLMVRHYKPTYFDVYATIIIIAQIALISFLRRELFYLYSYRLFFDSSIASLAIAGLAINIYLESAPAIKRTAAKIFNKINLPIREKHNN